MNKKDEFKPYIPADRVMPELTVTSIIMGVLLAVIFGAANAYLGLRVGMTVSASIPAAVISMGVIRIIMRKNSILESNMVQTIGSAGESLAAGAIFTMPALFLWAEEGLCSMPSLVEITLIALCGGVLGVLFMVPLRNALIVKEHQTLLYPEGTACADVLLAGEEGGANASTVFSGMGLAAVFKFIVDGLKVIPADVSAAFKSFKGEIGMEVYPALLGVGYIVGPKIASYMFVGSVFGWLVIIPLICLFGPDTWLYPAEAGTTIAQLYAGGGAAAIWSTYVKYIGAGAIATGGIISLIKSLPLIVKTFSDSMKSVKGGKNTSTARTAQDLPMQFILIGIVAMVVIIWAVPAIPVTLLGAALIVIFGFFFATVSSRMVGLVGSSNNPVSGMAIATLLIATMAIKGSGKTGIDGMTAAIAIGSVICIIAAIAGDTSQDLKTGYLLGATPKKQQIGELIGVLASGLAIGGVLYLLNAAWGYGGAEVPAPQATLMKMIVEGIMGGNLPWNLVFVGVFLALGLEILRIPVMPFAIGLYLPIYLNATIMIGGVVRMVMDARKNVDEKTKEQQSTDGTLYCAGMIAGEGLVGILLAIFAVFGINTSIGESVNFGNIGGVILMVLMIASLLYFSLKKKKKA
ncbi:oligopeptide transporter, OPT family [Faecalicatena fissicatena]|uniref:Oligopeptide transporter, OPT family n=1 Tax=Faecalicatena fissicatena TaxID=290055 RepID=A0ABX2H0K9_9FIRM|nr:oligopeptide transporter, OPT family [Faecalicatena fissicatena]MCB5866840.1 oligopeptide transporter, OPT family [Faecalicatena fissicatena]NSD83749.1 oligopeptide transporter, OPT family [Faecalicatena fissicatena]NSE56273.1 oligopeptide transporter, OPT family [Faecalicatena fissicatena]NSE65075.1 oligopeptide transporter, OPT family [Faecalicatena fissicatena]NSG31260.1 oligopeptide transporter, OPT family [Faecalicatena fissicatena]